jgi:hypothetical protein
MGSTDGDWVLLAGVELDPATAIRQARETLKARISVLVDHRGLYDAIDATTEIVKNALQHARGPYILTISSRPGLGLLRIGVWDADPVLPESRPTDPWAAGAQGLSLVAKIAVNWGATPTNGGKTVWFEIPDK